MKLKQLNTKLEEIEKSLEESDGRAKRHTGVAFVVFKERNDMVAIVDNFKVSNIERLGTYIFVKWFNC